MFWNIYGKRVIAGIRDKETMIWTWIFPIMLATLFYFAFAGLDAAGMLKVIPMGVVDNEQYRQDASFVSALESVSTGEDRLFDLRYFPDVNGADAALESGEIDGYIIAGGALSLIVKSDGLNQTIAKSFLDSYLQTKNSVEAVITRDLSQLGNLEELLSRVNYTEKISLSDNPVSAKIGYFYSMLAMICMYGCFQGLVSVSYLQANISALGARRTMSPVGRFRMVTYDLLGGMTVHYLSLLFCVAYIIFVLGIDFGSKLGMVLLTCFVGSVLGVAFGAMVSVNPKIKEQAKTAILITVNMICVFLSGLMIGNMNYIVMQNVPIAAWLNPASRIVDAFYCLYYYDNYERFFLNIGIISAMTVVLLVITSFFIGRQRYESI
ncbi:MAG: ABC transporter permease [Oscillospiraceae bacterium]|nr:ABC transporter permease [Oscillospiraceae bacterium]